MVGEDDNPSMRILVGYLLDCLLEEADRPSESRQVLVVAPGTLDAVGAVEFVDFLGVTHRREAEERGPENGDVYFGQVISRIIKEDESASGLVYSCLVIHRKLEDEHTFPGTLLERVFEFRSAEHVEDEGELVELKFQEVKQIAVKQTNVP